MNFFRRLFKRKPTVQCPRCLGKGRVDWDDIKRLGKELKWGPGRCAYCNGIGKVDPALTSKVAVDETYLTTNLPYAERKGVIDGNPQVLERMLAYNKNLDLVIQQIRELYYIKNLEAGEIADLLLESFPTDRIAAYKDEKRELLGYIERVIAHKK